MSRRDRSHEDEHEAGQERWLVSYADFITLMFAFFAVLYATSEKDLGRAEEFQESIKRFLIKAGGAGGSHVQINQGEKNNVPIEPPIETFRRGRQEAENVLNKAEQEIEEKFTAQERTKYIQDVGVDEWGVRITLNSSEIFASNSDKLKPDAVPFVDKMAVIISSSKSKVMIEGHVMLDEKAAYRSTWDFAAARAVNILRFMQIQKKLPAKKFVAASFGDSRPLTQVQTSQLNSRMEIVLLNQDLEL